MAPGVHMQPPKSWPVRSTKRRRWAGRSSKRCNLMDTLPGPATRLTVTVKSPATRHKLTMAKLESWLAGGARSPNEQVQKNR